MRTLRDYAEMEKIAKTDCEDLEKIEQRKAALTQQIEELTEKHKKLTKEVKKRKRTREEPPPPPQGKDMKRLMEAYEEETREEDEKKRKHELEPEQETYEEETREEDEKKRKHELEPEQETYEEEMPQKQEDPIYNHEDPLQQYFGSFTPTVTGDATTQTGKQKRSTTIKEIVNNEFRTQERIIKELHAKLDQFIEREQSRRHRRESAEAQQQRQIVISNDVVTSKLITLTEQIANIQKNLDTNHQLIRSRR